MTSREQLNPILWKLGRAAFCLRPLFVTDDRTCREARNARTSTLQRANIIIKINELIYLFWQIRAEYECALSLLKSWPE